MIETPDVPETPHAHCERGRMQLQSTDDSSNHTPLIMPHPWGVLHLLVADDALTEGHVYRCYLGLCGTLLPTSKLPPSTCPDDCEFDVLYCSECVRRAAEWTAEVQQAERASEALQ